MLSRPVFTSFFGQYLGQYLGQYSGRFFALQLALLMALGFSPAALAAGSSSYSAAPSKPAGYDVVLKLIRDKKFAEAIPALHKIEARAKTDADVQNLLGFSYRKTNQLDKAGRHYERALTLEPKHKGALEYQGELFLMLGDKASAEANLEKLKRICKFGCSELDDLKEALASYQG